MSHWAYFAVAVTLATAAFVVVVAMGYVITSC